MATTVTRVHHPIFTDAEVRRMPATVRPFFRDTREAHNAARADYERDSMASRLMRSIAA